MIKLTDKENEFLYYQLLARKNYFETEIKENPSDIRRVKQCVEAIDVLQKVMSSLLK